MSREVGCYPDISIAYHIFIYYTCDYRIGRKKFFEVEIIEELSEVTNEGMTQERLYGLAT